MICPPICNKELFIESPLFKLIKIEASPFHNGHSHAISIKKMKFNLNIEKVIQGVFTKDKNSTEWHQPGHAIIFFRHASVSSTYPCK